MLLQTNSEHFAPTAWIRPQHPSAVAGAPVSAAAAALSVAPAAVPPSVAAAAAALPVAAAAVPPSVAAAAPLAGAAVPLYVVVYVVVSLLHLGCAE